MFDAKSRYKDVPQYTVVDRRGREVSVVAPAPRRSQKSLGTHLRKAGERIDHLAARYLADATGFWRIAEHEDVMLPEALSETDEVEIPSPEVS